MNIKYVSALLFCMLSGIYFSGCFEGLADNGAKQAVPGWPGAWRVFGPFDKNDPLPDKEVLKTIPVTLLITNKVVPGVNIVAADGHIDFARLLGGAEDGKTAYAFAEIDVDHEIDAKIGAGADRWMQWWLDGEQVCKEISDYYYPPSIHNNIFQVHLTKGKHILAVRFVSNIRSGNLVAGWAQPPPVPKEWNVRDFFAMLNLTTPGLEKTAGCIKNEHYDQALKEYRAYFIRNIRLLNLGQFNNPTYMLHFRNVKIAERLVGYLTEQAYLSSVDVKNFYDIYGMSGVPGSISNINWLAKSHDEIINEISRYTDFNFTGSLPAMYWLTGNKMYLQKWFEICSDFARNQKRMIMSMDPEKRKLEDCNWSTSAGPALGQGIRVENLIKQLAALARSLPDGKDNQPWEEILRPVKGEVPEASLALIPAEQLAQIVFSLVRDHPAALLERYQENGACPNQRLQGLLALAMLTRVFNEFKSVQDLDPKVVAAFNKFAAAIFYLDGGMLEQAFNYNLGDLEKVKCLVDMYQPDLPEWCHKLQNNVEKFSRMCACLTVPMGGMPKLGTYYYPSPPVLWKDAIVSAEWKDGLMKNVMTDKDRLDQKIYDCLWGLGSKGQPAFTSVAFPYSGYYAMRNNWSMEALYLAFFAARPASGHTSFNNNAIQITAYGRHLLVSAGPPWYEPSHAPEKQRADFDAFSKYFEEDSSRAHNTLLVNGQNQSRRLDYAQSAYTNPIPARWHASPDFDLVEGLYEGGYGDHYQQAPWQKLNINMDVRHHRQVFFIRKAGVWIVKDIMLNKSEHNYAYSQVWHFPPWHEGEKQPLFNVAGFKEEQVKLDENAKRIYTQDRDGPNIFLYNFCSEPLRYLKYFGHRNPHLGWYACAISGEKLPAADVHVNWSAKGNQMLVTLIVPSRGMAPNIRDINDLSERKDNITGCRVALQDGTIITLNSAVAKMPVNVEPIKATADTLLVCASPDGKLNGIVLGCEALALSGTKQKLEYKDFEFEVQGDRITKQIPVRIPDGFQWRENGDDVMPVYDASGKSE